MVPSMSFDTRKIAEFLDGKIKHKFAVSLS